MHRTVGRKLASLTRPFTSTRSEPDPPKAVCESLAVWAVSDHPAVFASDFLDHRQGIAGADQVMRHGAMQHGEIVVIVTRGENF